MAEPYYSVKITGMPKFIVQASNPGKVRAEMRKLLKRADDIESVDRMSSAEVRAAFRDAIQTGELPEETYSPQKHEWGTAASIRWAKKITPGENVREEDEGEYDNEGEMAKNLLKSLMRDAEHMISMFDDDENLPEWVQGKIIKAQDYLSTAHSYLMSKKDGDMEESRVVSADKKIEKYRDPETGKTKIRMVPVDREIIKNEEVEQVDEISKATKSSYLDKASKDHYDMFTGRKPGTKEKLDKRRAVIQKVSKALTGKKKYSDYDPKTKQYTNEEVEQVEEGGVKQMKPIKGKIGEPKKIGIHDPKPPGVYAGVKQMKPIKGKIGEPKKIGIHKEEVEQMNEYKKGTYVKHPRTGAVGQVTNRSSDKSSVDVKWNKTGKTSSHPTKKLARLEGVEQVDELKKSTLASYIGKAAGNVAVTSRLGAEFRRDGEKVRNKERSKTLHNIGRDFLRQADKRRIGIKKAANKLAKEEVEQTSMSSVIEKYGMKKMKKEGIAPEAYADNSFGVGIPMEYDENNNLVEKDKKSKMWQIKKGY